MVRLLLQILRTRLNPLQNFQSHNGAIAAAANFGGN